MVNYDPGSAASAQVFPMVNLPSTSTPVTAEWLNHVHAVLTEVLAAGGRLPLLELPEAATSARTTADSTPANLTGKTTRYDTTGGAISQALPNAVPGRVLAIGWEAGTAALTLTAAAGDVIGAGTADTFAVGLSGELITLHCTTTGRWRASSGYKPQTALDSRFSLATHSHGTSAVGQSPRTGAYIAAVAATGTGGPPTNIMRVSPVQVAAGFTADRIGLEVTTAVATSVVRLGIYADDPSTGLPGELLLDAGTIDASTTGFKEITISQAIAAGRYWLAGVSQTATAQIRCNSGGVAQPQLFPGFAQSDIANNPAGVVHNVGVSGGLPATFVPGSSNAISPRVYLRCA